MSSDRVVSEDRSTPPADDARLLSRRVTGDWNVDLDEGPESTGDPRASGGVSEEVQATDDAGAAAGRDALNGTLNESLARLEMNTLEVKLHLDSIDQRISRMEPRLEGIRAGEQPERPRSEESSGTGELSGSAREELPEPWSAAAETSTAERRRRMQGVPAERRRAPLAEPAGRPPSNLTPRPWFKEAAGVIEPLRAMWRRRWVPPAVLGLVAAVGLGYWDFGHRTRPEGVVTSLDAGPVLAGASVPTSGGMTAPRPTQPGHATRLGTVGVEQGVLAPVGSLGAFAPPAKELRTDTGGPAVTVVPPSARGGDATAKDADEELSSAPKEVVISPAHAGGGGPVTTPRNGSRVHVSSGVMAGNLLYSPQPTYPHGIAGIFHTEGSVRLQAVISKSGRVEDLKVLSGHFVLRGAAKDAVRTWRYRPYHVNGLPVEVATIVTVEFHR